MRSLRRHTQMVRPQVQQAAIFLISLHHVTPVSGLPERALLTGCVADRGSWLPLKCPLFWRKSLAPVAEVGFEGAGHDSRGARAEVSAGVGRAVEVPAGGVGHGQALEERVENTKKAPAVPPSQGPPMLLWMSRRYIGDSRGDLQGRVDFTNYIAFETTDDLGLAHPLLGARSMYSLVRRS